MMGVRDQGRRRLSPNNSSTGDMDGGLPRVRRRNSSVDSTGDARKRRRGSPGSRNDVSRYEPAVPRRASYAGGGGSMSGTRDYGGSRDYGGHNGSNNYGNGYSTSPPPATSYGRPPSMAFANNSKSRRLYVGNLPFNVGLTEHALVQFFSAIYIAAFRPQKSDSEPLPCGSVWLRSDGNFGFMELRGDQEAINMMQLNGIYLHGRPLRINRPSDYTVPYHIHENMAPEKVNVQGVVDLCEQLQGIVAPPADIRNYITNYSPKNGGNKTETLPAQEKHEQQEAQAKLMSNGMENGRNSSNNNNNKKESKPAENIVITPPQQAAQAVQIPRSEPNRKQMNSNGSGINGNNNDGQGETKSDGTGSVESKSERVSGTDSNEECGNVVSLVNLVTDKDLDGTKDEFEDLVDDVKSECGQYGTVTAVEIPRSGPWRSTAFVEYAEKEHALAAVNALRARVFEGMKIAAKLVVGCKSAKEAVLRTK